MISPSAPPMPKVNKIKQYNLIISIHASQHGAGTALTTNVFGPYDSLQDCKDAGAEAKGGFAGFGVSFNYTCVPTYKKAYV